MAMIRRCGISSTPTRSSMLQHHGRRRMTLGMLLLSSADNDWKPHPRQSMERQGITSSKEVVGKNTLKDLMSSTRFLLEKTVVDDQVFVFQEKGSTGGNILPPLMSGGGHGDRRVRRGVSRPATASAGLRIRFFKRAWRPVLGAIPEGNFLDATPHMSPH